MTTQPPSAAPSRRDLLRLIGLAGGGSALYAAMTALGHAAPSQYEGPLRLQGRPRAGRRVLILGAGLAGLTAAHALKDAGYQVQILEYQRRTGGRCYTLRRGDVVQEMGGGRYTVGLSAGQYFNPGPWRIPHNHHAVIDTCRRLGVRLEPFIQYNGNAYLHSSQAFGGQPQRFRQIRLDYEGGVAELLAKGLKQNELDARLSKEDQEILLESLRSYGLLDANLRYRKDIETANYRGYARPPGGGVTGAPEPSKPIALADILRSGLWEHLRIHDSFLHQSPMFQPVGGMDRIADALQRGLEPHITHDAQVTRIRQDTRGVTVQVIQASSGGAARELAADWCVCTLPFSVLSQMAVDFNPAIMNALRRVWYTSAYKCALEMRERFWETEEQIYGGVTYTDLPITQIGYPSQDLLAPGPGVLMGAYHFGARALQFNSLAPEERVRRTLDYVAQIHPQAKRHFVSGIGYSWHRNPWMLGCRANWPEDRADYDAAVQVDRRIVLAGEHMSYLNGWLEGAILSAQDATRRLHERVMAA